MVGSDTGAPIRFFSCNQPTDKSLRMKTVQIAFCFSVVSLLFAFQRADGADPKPPPRLRPRIAPTEAISRLKEGNSRFVAGNVQHPHETSDERAYIAKNSYENHDAISLGMTTQPASKRVSALTQRQPPCSFILSFS